MGAECSLPCFKSPKHVVQEDLNKLQDKCNIHDNKESPTAESSINLNLGTSLETESTTEVGTVENTQIQNKFSAPKSHDTTLKPLEEGSVCNPDQTNIESLEQDKINSSSQTLGSPVGRASASSLNKNGEVFSNLQRVVPDCRIIVEMNLESCSNDCLNEAKNNIENGANKQDKLLEASMSPEIIPVNSTRRKLLILDVNGLLVDIVQFQPNWRIPDKKVSRRSVYKRPFCDDFIKFCFDRFNVGIWSSRTRRNLEAVLNIFIGDDKNKLLFCWDQSHCTSTGFKTIENRNKPLFLKELKKIWDKEEPNLPWEKGEYTPSNTLLLDDSPYKALRNPPYTAIFPRPYNFQDENDNSLGPEGDLRVYLEGLARSDDVRCYVQKHPFGQHAITSADPSWPFYLKVIGVENSSAPALCHQGC
ncbi:hypothetical protein MRB53_017083 [Persea americana]|uniref:Uncharacterized protein n=1 Tax=Persea americana TaxID=3435 RepID=A0ACC2M3Z6_PERAE|nr:hypothetical protein MRB53_017083 [Persea americana]